MATGMQSVWLAAFCSHAGERSSVRAPGCHPRCVRSATNMLSEPGCIVAFAGTEAREFPHSAASSCPGSPAPRPPCRSPFPVHGSPASPRHHLADAGHRGGQPLRRRAARRSPGRRALRRDGSSPVPAPPTGQPTALVRPRNARRRTPLTVRVADWTGRSLARWSEQYREFVDECRMCR